MTVTDPLTGAPLNVPDAPDAYDRAVAFLTKNPNCIYKAWIDAGDGEPHTLEGWLLFRNCTPDGVSNRPDGKFGCLTQVAGRGNAFTEALTQEIRADPLIPDSPHLISAKHLPAFASWQRRLDKEFGRETPK